MPTPARFLRAFTLLGLIASAALAQTVETERFSVTLKPDGALEVLDKPAQARWVQPAPRAAIDAVKAGGREIAFRLDGKFAVKVTVDAAGLDLTIDGDPAASIGGLEFPAGFTLADGGGAQRLLLPNCSGLAIPFSMKDEPSLKPALGNYEPCVSQRGLMMPWLGVDAGPVGSLMLLTTPYDATFKVGAAPDGYRYGVSWLNTKGRLGYARGVRYYFEAHGGMVALCKSYRAYAKARGLLVTLKEKRQAAPQLDRFIGALSFWISDWPDISLLQEMKSAGIDRALVSYHSTENVPAGVTSRPGHNTTYEAVGRDYAQQVHGLGFLVGRYDYYRTIFPPGDAGQGGNGWIMRSTGYPEQLALDEQGRIRPGFDAQRGTVGELIRGNRASRPQYEMARAYIPLDVDRVGYDARLLDAVCAVGFQEDYSPLHPATRTEDMEWRSKQLGVATECGQVTGTEAFAAWAVPVAVYGEGPTTFVRFFRSGTPAGGRLKPAVPIEMPDEYRQVVLNERLRAPLWQLVFGDASVLTNRWNITANRYTTPRDWDQEDLLNALHGHMPTMLISKATYPAAAKRLLQTYRTVCESNARVGYDEMTGFRWLAPDGSVQQAAYASGQTVTVNFGDRDFELPGGGKVPARGTLSR